MGKKYGLDSGFKKCQHPSSAFGNNASAYSLDSVYQRRIVKDNQFFPSGRAVIVYQCYFFAYKGFCQLFWVADGCGTEYKDRF
jgi:hypothetical protein